VQLENTIFVIKLIHYYWIIRSNWQCWITNWAQNSVIVWQV